MGYTLEFLNYDDFQSLMIDLSQETVHSAVFLSLSCVPKYLFRGFPYTNVMLFVLIFNVPDNKQNVTCLAQGQNTLPLVWLEQGTPKSQVYH